MWDPYSEFEKTVLPNGLSVYAAHWPDRPWEAVGFLIHSGASQDTIGLDGIAHYVEHLVSNNTLMTDREIENYFENIGGSTRLGSTSHKFTRYSFFIPIMQNVIEESLNLFGHMLLSAKLENCIERERATIQEEFIKSFPMEFRYIQMRETLSILYPNHWLSRNGFVLGNLETIKKITPKDLQSFYDTHYTPANISVVGIGGMTLRELEQKLRDSCFNIFKDGRRYAMPQPIDNLRAPVVNKLVRRLSKHFKSEVRAASLNSWAIFPGNIEYEHISILRNMLSKKLHEIIRLKKAWTYYIGVDTEYFRCFSELCIHCPSFNPGAIQEIEQEINDCIAAISIDKSLLEQEIKIINKRSRLIDVSAQKLLDIVTEELSEHDRIQTIAEMIRIREQMTMKELAHLMTFLSPKRRLTTVEIP